MKFEINQLIYAFDEGNEEKLCAIAYLYQRNLDYVYENDYSLMELLLNVIIDRIYDMPGRGDAQDNRLVVVQDEYFEVLRCGISRYSYVCDNVHRCADRLVGKINKVPMNSWELAQTLLVISGTEDKKYLNLMERYKDHEDAYVREAVEEYFYDVEMEEEKCKRSWEKGSDLKSIESREIYFDVMMDRFLAVNDHNIKEDYIRSLTSVIREDRDRDTESYNVGIKRLMNKINTVSMSSWELAKTLLAIGCTRDKMCWEIMKQYQNHEDAYVREVVQDYFDDMRRKSKV